MIPKEYLTEKELKRIHTLEEKIKHAETKKEIQGYMGEVKSILERVLIRYHNEEKIRKP